MRDVLQERVSFTAGCEVIPLKLDLGTISKNFLSVPSGKGELKVGHFCAIKQNVISGKSAAVDIRIWQRK